MNTNKIIDISVPVSENLARWPGSPGYSFRFIGKKNKGDFATNAEIRLDIHLGTHLDAPLHHIPDGKSIEDLDLSKCLGVCAVLDFRGISRITEHDIREKLERSPKLKQNKLLFKTDNSSILTNSPGHFHKEYSALDKSAAQFIADNKFHLVGIDYYSIQKFEDPADTHEVLLEKEILILETINLEGVQEGIYFLSCLPIKFVGLEGSPCRAILSEL